MASTGTLCGLYLHERGDVHFLEEHVRHLHCGSEAHRRRAATAAIAAAAAAAAALGGFGGGAQERGAPHDVAAQVEFESKV